MKDKETTVHYEVFISKTVKGRNFGLSRRFVSVESHPDSYTGMTEKEAKIIGDKVYKVTTIYERIK